MIRKFILGAVLLTVARLGAAQGRCEPLYPVNAITAMSAIAAVGFNCIPTTCPAGQVPNGIDMKGNALGCAPLSTSTGTFTGAATFVSSATFLSSVTVDGTMTVNGPTQFNGLVTGLTLAYAEATNLTFTGTDIIGWQGCNVSGSTLTLTMLRSDPVEINFTGTILGSAGTQTELLGFLVDGAFVRGYSATRGAVLGITNPGAALTNATFGPINIPALSIGVHSVCLGIWSFSSQEISLDNTETGNIFQAKENF